MHPYRTTRRQAVQWLGTCAVPLLARGLARADHLPLHTTGIEHFGFAVPDPEATAKFYGRIFDGQLFQEKDPPPRFYVKLGAGYLAFGGNANASPSIDHFCALIENYQPPEMRKNLERVWFRAARTKLGLELVAAGEKPSIHHVCVRVAGFDKKSAMEKLKRADIESSIQNTPADEGFVRFRDPNGIVMELKGES